MHSRRRIWVPHTPGLRVGPSTFPRSFRMHHFDNSPLPLTPHRHFERSRPADFFFRIRSCECVGFLRAMKSLFSFLSPAKGASRLLPEVTCEIKSNPECAYSNGGNGGWALQCVLAIKSIKRNSSFRHQCKTPSLGKEGRRVANSPHSHGQQCRRFLPIHAEGQPEKQRLSASRGRYGRACTGSSHTEAHALDPG